VELSLIICTHQRPAYLKSLIESIACQSNQLHDSEIVVVDDDPNFSARPVIESASQNTYLTLKYIALGSQNISTARNTGLDAAVKSLLLMIDDDQLLPLDFFCKLRDAWDAFAGSVDGCIVHILPLFDRQPKSQLVRCAYKWSQYTEGAPVALGLGRTGGLLLKRDFIMLNRIRFSEAMGKSGGEDTDFLYSAQAAGGRYVWLSSVHIHERIPEQRATRPFVLRRSFSHGVRHGTHCMHRAPKIGKLEFAVTSPVQLVVSAILFVLASACGRTAFSRAGLLLARQLGKNYAMFGGKLNFY
jgi:succinoglycan biosynthesis protein ExoM